MTVNRTIFSDHPWMNGLTEVKTILNKEEYVN
jgi:hypothetical protein